MLIRKFSLNLFLYDEVNKTKKLYYIDDLRSLHIMYNEVENSYLVTFKVERKQHVVSTRRFHISGCTYAK